MILVMPQFLEVFPRVSANASGAGFWKGLLTAMIELGALLGKSFPRGELRHCCGSLMPLLHRRLQSGLDCG